MCSIAHFSCSSKAERLSNRNSDKPKALIDVNFFNQFVVNARLNYFGNAEHCEQLLERSEQRHAEVEEASAAC